VNEDNCDIDFSWIMIMTKHNYPCPSH